MDKQLLTSRANTNTILNIILRGSILLSLLLLGCFFLPGKYAAVQIPEPAPDLYVLDQAGVMNAETRTMIVSTSQELAQLTKAQVAVVTMQTLNDQNLEEVSLGILRQWQLGDKKLNNGVLILLVTQDRRSRIEVGYGLEGVLTDGKTGRIQDEYMLPYFKQGDYDAGLRNGYAAIVQEIAKEYNVSLTVNPVTKANPDEKVNTGRLPGWTTILGILFVLLLLWVDYRYLNGFILGFLLGMLFRGGGGGGFGGGGFGGGGGSSGGGGSGGGGGSSRGW